MTPRRNRKSQKKEPKSNNGDWIPTIEIRKSEEQNAEKK